MVVLDGQKYACERCIRGHRVSQCTHTDQILIRVKPKGRPSTHCSHCRDNRRVKNTHTKCTCGKQSNPADSDCQCQTTSVCACSSKSRNRRPSFLMGNQDEEPDAWPAFIKPGEYNAVVAALNALPSSRPQANPLVWPVSLEELQKEKDGVPNGYVTDPTQASSHPAGRSRSADSEYSGLSLSFSGSRRGSFVGDAYINDSGIASPLTPEQFGKLSSAGAARLPTSKKKSWVDLQQILQERPAITRSFSSIASDTAAADPTSQPRKSSSASSISSRSVMIASGYPETLQGYTESMHQGLPPSHDSSLMAGSSPSLAQDDEYWHLMGTERPSDGLTFQARKKLASGLGRRPDSPLNFEHRHDDIIRVMGDLSKDAWGGSKINYLY